ncbi:hypothetical protein ACFSKM_17030 [Ancylobacter dichloromethanicus]
MAMSLAWAARKIARRSAASSISAPGATRQGPAEQLGGTGGVPAHPERGLRQRDLAGEAGRQGADVDLAEVLQRLGLAAFEIGEAAAHQSLIDVRRHPLGEYGTHGARPPAAEGENHERPRIEAITPCLAIRRPEAPVDLGDQRVLHRHRIGRAAGHPVLQPLQLAHLAVERRGGDGGLDTLAGVRLRLGFVGEGRGNRVFSGASRRSQISLSGRSRRNVPPWPETRGASAGTSTSAPGAAGIPTGAATWATDACFSAIWPGAVGAATVGTAASSPSAAGAGSGVTGKPEAAVSVWLGTAMDGRLVGRGRGIGTAPVRCLGAGAARLGAALGFGGTGKPEAAVSVWLGTAMDGRLVGRGRGIGTAPVRCLGAGAARLGAALGFGGPPAGVRAGIEVASSARTSPQGSCWAWSGAGPRSSVETAAAPATRCLLGKRLIPASP